MNIQAALENGAEFVYAKPVQIVKPRPNIWRLVLVRAICALFPPYVAILGIPTIFLLYLSMSSV